MASGPSDIQLRRRQFKSQQSTVQSRREKAVCVRSACKRFGTKKDPCIVLDGLDMTVPRGVIYGLLGASGCGKTTLLNCIVGRKRLNSGEIWVLGGRPGSRGSGVPGPRIGYMPQDLALYGDFTIHETLQFFGWLANMDNDQIRDRMDFLVKLLMLPDIERQVGVLSIGQQRRVSLASALLHEPELLILDEPTVGVDPLLRQIIWDHFVSITRSGQTTVIITTHYIDETRQAHLIGLMRGGSFLAEESPEKLMARMGTETLEDVFLKLSVMQNLGRRRRSTIAQIVTGSITLPSGIVNRSAVIEELDVDNGEISGEFGDNISLQGSTSRRASIMVINEDDENDEYVLPELPPEEQPPLRIMDYVSVWRRHHMKALIWKNFLWMLRNKFITVAVVFMPLIQVALFHICVGHEPTDIPVAIVNHETNNTLNCATPLTCNNTRLSCNYLSHLETGYLKLIPYDSEKAAVDSVLTGKTYASILIKYNYSIALQSRVQQQQEVTKWSLENSEIEVVKDFSNKVVTTFVQLYLLEQFEIFIKEYLVSCDMDERTLNVPLTLKTPIYGANKPNFTAFITPGVMLAVIFGMTTGLTALVLLIERKEGSFERYLVVGVSGVEMLSSHLVSQFVLVILQLLLTLCTFPIFNLTLQGSLVLVAFLLLLTGLCGMFYGFVVSCACDSERTAIYLVLGSFLPVIVLCGIIWPIEGMNYYLQQIVYFLPFTHATESMRSILERGWDLSMKTVYMGFISISTWTVICLLVSVLTVKFKKG